ncbi:hypothetical protein M3A96_08115 [Helcobacillus massiliensis]|uniref:Uncharacterized protein n=1 Tax=Helcobacillus massiliensis TaxID=521392 RepID=A0A839QW46_9MICO|nr:MULTISPECIES: hypothetical protein [Helcobacillus]MBB3023858.1 hypothetical protein [Helcobacillus massiliensis]MCG7427785.1 hypothetical protein [Helcobacillus sp. ACRRO]MCT1558078.1 hypothetical protein [Helcobacillus massiliensis]MCT2036623.1 hypothetical protein [Helcobacillus massiliensis]MCT2332503.1 hypothetical protein [Helcobacillus massiliensis]
MTDTMTSPQILLQNPSAPPAAPPVLPLRLERRADGQWVEVWPAACDQCRRPGRWARPGWHFCRCPQARAGGHRLLRCKSCPREIVLGCATGAEAVPYRQLR